MSHSSATPLTDGQARMRAIVRANLPDYHRAVGEADQQAKWQVFAHLQHQLAGDPVVRADRVTGRRLGYYDVADEYMSWLVHHSRKVTPIPADEVMRLDQFVYTRPNGYKVCWYAFSRGGKWRTTMSLLFALADGRPVDSWNLDAEYYRRSGFLAVGSGGNHRLMAQVLWGQPAGLPAYRRPLRGAGSGPSSQ